MTVVPTDRIVRRDDVLAAAMGEEQVLLDPASEHYVGLDAIGSAIWSGIATARPVAALCDDLAAAFAGDRSTIERDTLQFLDRLVDLGLARKT